VLESRIAKPFAETDRWAHFQGFYNYVNLSARTYSCEAFVLRFVCSILNTFKGKLHRKLEMSHSTEKAIFSPQKSHM